MRALIRFITTNAAGSQEFNDRIVDAPAITMGRATDQVLHLRDKRARLQHASIEKKNGDIHIVSRSLAGVTVNGKSTRDAVLSSGDQIEVGANLLRVIDHDGEVDFAFTFELSDTASDDTFDADWVTPSPGIAGWSKRRLAATLAVVVAVFALVLPALSMIGDGGSRSIPLLPDDGLWSAGPIHSAHTGISNECEACHVNAFERVPDSACMDCHTVAKHSEQLSHPVMGEMRCASCHQEHNTPEQLVNQHQGLCGDCHSELPETLDIAAASDFGDAHPGFRASLVQPEQTPDGIDWTIKRALLSESVLTDQSNLRFDHAVHLSENGIFTPEGRRQLECTECHVPDQGGGGMQAIAMDQHCSGCHTLTFDPDDPQREVPHGDAPAVVQALIEYYSARLLGEDPDAVEQRVRRPGQRLSRADRDRVAGEARKQALDVAKDLFERQACATCHEVSRQDGNADIPWFVLPVRLTDTFFPHASFRHAAHDTEVTSCDSCHDASSSTTSTDVLIPDIDNCRACHGSGIKRKNASTQLPSTCVTCHSFHFDERGDYP